MLADNFVIATTNVGHLSRFVPAAEWQTIQADDDRLPADTGADFPSPPGPTSAIECPPAVNRTQCLPSQASARARRKALSRSLRVSVAAASNSERASASRPARNRKSPLAAGKGA